MEFYKHSRLISDIFLATVAFVADPVLLQATTTNPFFTEEDRAYWAFQPIAKPLTPDVEYKQWVRNPIDAFILQGLEAKKLKPTPEADRRTLIRRASLDLLGLPPTPEEIDQFVNDPAPDAYEQLIDRLLESPHYGERYARHWLDLVRYADSDGFKADVIRPNAWRYRDYVIESLNADKPYSRFVREQIAGDELYPQSQEAKIATGYLRLWPYEDNQPDMDRHWNAILDDIADVSGDVFLGMSMKCARCHDHKFDAITQKDYYGFRSFFGAISPWEDIRLGNDQAVEEYNRQLREWEVMTASIRAELEAIDSPYREQERQAAFAKLPEYMQALMLKNDPTPYELQLIKFGEKLIHWRAEKTFRNHIKGEESKRYTALEKQLATFDEMKPKELPEVAAVRDIGSTAPVSYIEGKKDLGEIQPSFLSILGSQKPSIPSLPENLNSTGLRSALAEWLTDPENPLTVRVMTNRMWQWHFGKGIVTSSNDFGNLGDNPSHPQLLDWLARRFVEDGWSMKSMHRLIMTSSTYRQGSVRKDEPAELVDEHNELLWKMPIRRMDAEQIRDSMLFVSGEMDNTHGGPAVDEEKASRRSIYVLNKRNKMLTTMNSFDTPDLHNSCAMRDVTTTALQALTLLNGPWTLNRAEHLAEQVLKSDAPNTRQRITTAYQTVLGRAPNPDELKDIQAFFDLASQEDEKSAWVDFCHVLLNTNEFLYIN